MDGSSKNSNDAALVCTKCDFVAPDQIALRSHVSYRHLDACVEEGECPYCEFSFYDETVEKMQIKGMIWEHLIIIHKENLWMRTTVPLKYRCGLCQVCFYSDAELQEHVVVDHANRAPALKKILGQNEEGPVCSKSTGGIAESNTNVNILEKNQEKGEEVSPNASSSAKRRKYVIDNSVINSTSINCDDVSSSNASSEEDDYVEENDYEEEEDGEGKVKRKSKKELRLAFDRWAKSMNFYYDGTLFVCALCKNTFGSVLSMEQHLQNTHDKPPFLKGKKCPACPYKYTGKHKENWIVRVGIARHIQKRHLTPKKIVGGFIKPQTLEEASRVTEWMQSCGFLIKKKVYKCLTCFKEWTSFIEVYTHLYQDHGKPKFLSVRACPLCKNYKYTGKFEVGSKAVDNYLCGHIFRCHLKMLPEPVLASSVPNLHEESQPAPLSISSSPPSSTSVLQLATTTTTCQSVIQKSNQSQGCEDNSSEEDDSDNENSDEEGDESQREKTLTRENELESSGEKTKRIENATVEQLNQYFNNWARSVGFFYNGRDFVCSLCDAIEYKTLCLMERHLRKVHAKPSFWEGRNCPVCKTYEYNGNFKKACKIHKNVVRHIEASHLTNIRKAEAEIITRKLIANENSRLSTWMSSCGFSFVDDVYNCKICKKESTTLIGIERHLEQKHFKPSFLNVMKCPVCDDYKYTGEITYTLRTLKLRMTQHIYFCHLRKICENTIATDVQGLDDFEDKSLKATPARKVPVSCALNNWARSKGFIYDGLLFHCNICKQGVSTLSDIENHLRNEHDKAPFLDGLGCPLCDSYKFTGKSKSLRYIRLILIRHIKRSHLVELFLRKKKNPNELVNRKLNKSSKTVPKKPSKSFRKKSSKPLKKTTRKQLKLANCQSPSRRYNTRLQERLAKLRPHHYDSTIFQKCRPAESLKKSKYARKINVLYKCKFCSHRSQCLMYIKHHMKKVHLSTCGFCKKMFRCRSDLTKHIRELHDSVTKSCTKCPMKFYTCRSLDIHMTQHHKTPEADVHKKPNYAWTDRGISLATIFKASLDGFNLTLLPLFNSSHRPTFNNYHSFKIFCESQLTTASCRICGNKIDDHGIIQHYLDSHNPNNLGEKELYVLSLKINGSCKICGITNITQTHINYHRFVTQYVVKGTAYNRTKLAIERFMEDCFFLSPELWTVFLKTLLFYKSLMLNQIYLCLWIPFKADNMKELLQGFASYDKQNQLVKIPYYVITANYIKQNTVNVSPFSDSSAFNLFVIPLFVPAQSTAGFSEQGCRTAFAKMELLIKGLLHLRKGFDVFQRIKFQPVGRQHTKDKLRRYLSWFQRHDVEDLFEKVFDPNTTIFCKNNLAGSDCRNEDCKALAHFDELAHLIVNKRVNGNPNVPVNSVPPFRDVSFFADDPAQINAKGKDYYVEDFMRFQTNFRKTLKDNAYMAVVSKKDSDFPIAASSSLILPHRTLNNPYYIYVGKSTFSGISPCHFGNEKKMTMMAQAHTSGYINHYELFNQEFVSEKAEVVEALVQLGGIIYNRSPYEDRRKFKVINYRQEYNQLALASFEIILQFITVCLSPSGFILEDEPEDCNEGLVEYFGKRLIIKQACRIPGSFPHVPRFDEEGNMVLEAQENRYPLENYDNEIDFECNDAAIL